MTITTIQSRATEVWAKGKRMRAITVCRGSGEVDVRLVNYVGYEEFAKYVRSWNLEQATRTSLVCGGSERWYWGLTKEEARKKLEGFRKRAQKAGFACVGSYPG